MLGIGSGSFDPETLVILETAFDEAWITLKSSGSMRYTDNSLSTAILSKSSLKRLIRYSGGWPSGTGRNPVTVYVPRAALCIKSVRRSE
jgi:hypothetical protein